MSNKAPRFTSPKGIAVYPRLGKPDVKFHDLGIYKADIQVSMNEVKPLLAKLLEIHKSHTGEAANKFKNYMFEVETDEDGEVTGKVLLKLRVKNRTGKDGEVWDRKPKMFDASLTPCPNAKPFGGSEMIVNFEAYAWNSSGKKGVSLQPVAVQILNLIEGDGSVSADGFGFEAAEGFTAPAMTDDTTPVVAEDDSSEADW